MLKTSDTGLDLVNNLVPINGIYQTIIFRRGEHGAPREPNTSYNSFGYKHAAPLERIQETI